VAQPTLAELMAADRPAWLWDADRCRIVWANAEGVRALGGETLFDLLDQPFDPAEEGMARIRAVVKELAPGEAAVEMLKLPGALDEVPLPCSLSIHSLADGRPGLLVVAERPAAGEPLPARLLGEMLSALPMGLLLAASDGSTRFVNDWARRIVEEERLGSLADLLGSAGEADKLVRRTKPSRLVSAIMALPTRYGRREVRVTARPLTLGPAAGDPLLLVLLEDVSDRRALERALAGLRPAGEAATGMPAGRAGPAGGALSDSDRQAFEALAAAIVASAAEGKPSPGGRPGPQAEVRQPASDGAAQAQKPPSSKPLHQAEGAGLAWQPRDAELRAIIDTATDGIVTLDEAGYIRGFSAGAEALFGYRLAEVAGRPFTDLLAPEGRKIVQNYLAALGESGLGSVFSGGREVEAVVPRGGTVPLFITIGRIGASSGTRDASQAYCVVVRDLTNWKKTEAELRRAKEEAERASAQKSEFLANISHELRTPLNAILGFSEVMRTQRFGEIANRKYLGYAHDIHESGEHLLSLINDLLDLSKVEAGKLELNFTSVNIASLVDNCFAVMQENAAAARVLLRKTMPADLPTVVADQRSMKQILLNLISNSIKFTDPGGQVTVSARLARSGELTLSVRDTGIGMTEVEVQAALEPFKRVHVPRRDIPPGTGLGLPLTKALVEANRASFTISSEPQKGTLVEITFPTTRVLAG
jgi:PAS domain S-box-containing protein